MMNLQGKISSRKKSAIMGFVLSLICTFFAYLLTYHDPSRSSVYMVIVAFLGLLQCFFYMHYFMQIAQSEDASSSLWMFLLMITMAIIIIIGSIWIMNNLNYYTMPS